MLSATCTRAMRHSMIGPVALLLVGGLWMVAANAADVQSDDAKAQIDTLERQFLEFTKQVRTLRCKASFFLKMGTDQEFEYLQHYDVASEWPKKLAVRRHDGRFGGDIVFDGVHLHAVAYISGSYEAQTRPKDWLLTQGDDDKSKPPDDGLQKAGWGPAFVAGLLVRILRPTALVKIAGDANEEVTNETQYLGVTTMKDGQECHHLRVATKKKKETKEKAPYQQFDLWFATGEPGRPHTLSWQVKGDENEVPTTALEIRFTDWIVNGELAADEFDFVRPEFVGSIDAESQRMLRHYSKWLRDAKTLSANAEFRFETPGVDRRQTNHVAIAGPDKFAARRQTGDGGGQLVSNGAECTMYLYRSNSYHTFKPLDAQNQWRTEFEQLKRCIGQGTAASIAPLRSGFLQGILDPEGSGMSIEMKSLGLEEQPDGVQWVRLRAAAGKYNLDLWFTKDETPELRKVAFGPCALTPDLTERDPSGRPKQSIGHWTVTYSNWTRDEDLPGDTFEFQPPEGAKRDQPPAAKAKLLWPVR